jgi:3-phosphoshikimate 1-carboxyvinyltransferase
MLWSEDTEVMLHAWQQLGLDISIDHESHACVINGCAGKLPINQAKIYVANSGTTIRFLTAALAACHGEFEFHGVPRMHERPIGDLCKALSDLGTEIVSLNKERTDCPPLQIKARGYRGGSVEVAGNVSSQFLSGLMMAAPYATSDLNIQIIGDLVSKPYVDMTATVMKSFGVDAQVNSTQVTVTAPQTYQGTTYNIEPDASAASYFLAAAAITNGQATVEGLSKSSLQGDILFANVLERMGCEVQWSSNSVTVIGTDRLKGIDVDMSNISDTVQTLASVAAFADSPTRITGVEHNRFKETDRISDLTTELKRLGLKVDESRDGMTIYPGPIKPVLVHTYNDHRMAMGLSLIGLRAAEVWIDNPACTAKTYPHYFDDMCKCFGLEAARK